MCNCRKNRDAAAVPPALPRQTQPTSRQRPQPLSRQVQPPPPAEPEPIDPALWGPQLWFILHTLAELSATTSTFARWTRLLELLKSGLRCPECQGHFNAWVDAHPFPAAGTRDQRVAAARQWVLALHNTVNERRGVPVWEEAAVVATYGVGDRALARRTARARLAEIRERLGDRAWRLLQLMLSQA